MANATGWSYLIDGHIIQAVYHMYDVAFLHWTISILFIAYQIIILLKTRNLLLSFITGVFFVAMYAGLAPATSPLKGYGIMVMIGILVFELGGLIYYLIWK